MSGMETAYDYKRERTLAFWFLIVAFAALALGGLIGLFQALEHAGINWYPQIQPILGTYYRALTLHGVLNALVWTTFFISGFLLIALTRSLERPSYIWVSWVGFAIMLVGVGMAAWAMLSGNASVLYTFYVPMRAHALHYIGLTLIVVGTWFHSANFFLTWRAWRRENPNVKTPMATVAALTTWLVWDLATIGVATEMLTMVIPWSLGLIENTNPLLARTLFWYFGHPLVYFWLLPAYASWYAMLPKQAGGKLFSDPLGRLAFMLFILFSAPVGLHHQFTDPGISSAWKAVHAALTYIVTFPSLMTAFTLMATLEYAGKQRGGKGIIGWIFRLPWGDPSFAAQVFAMIIFAAGGVSGVLNASYTINLVVHNTTWVPGHFHLTVGTASTLTFMGVTYWLLPYITKRRLFSKPVALAQAWTWFIGMLLFGRGMHWAGLLGAPRRVPFAQATYTADLIANTANRGLGGFNTAMALVAIGGVILVISGLLYYVNVVGTLLAKKGTAMDVDMPIAEALSGPENAPAILDRWRVWIGGAIVIILIAYVPVLIAIIQASAWNAPGLLIR
jgi:cytochrome c oxidase subunit 1